MYAECCAQNQLPPPSFAFIFVLYIVFDERSFIQLYTGIVKLIVELCIIIHADD